MPEKIIKCHIPVLFAKFCAIGVLNSVIGYSIIFFSLYALKLNYIASNATGYAAGFIISFCLNKFTNFKSMGAISYELPKFLVSFFVAYGVNNLTLITCVEFFHLSQLISIVIAGITYTMVFYLLSRYIVFTNALEQK